MRTEFSKPQKRRIAAVWLIGGISANSGESSPIPVFDKAGRRFRALPDQRGSS